MKLVKMFFVSFIFAFYHEKFISMAKRNICEKNATQIYLEQKRQICFMHVFSHFHYLN